MGEFCIEEPTAFVFMEPCDGMILAHGAATTRVEEFGVAVEVAVAELAESLPFGLMNQCRVPSDDAATGSMPITIRIALYFVEQLGPFVGVVQFLPFLIGPWHVPAACEKGGDCAARASLRSCIQVRPIVNYVDAVHVQQK